jgi:hypothetical protein
MAKLNVQSKCDEAQNLANLTQEEVWLFSNGEVAAFSSFNQKDLLVSGPSVIFVAKPN